MQTTFFNPSNDTQIRLDYVAYEFYRVRKYYRGVLTRDDNGSKEEMQAVLDNYNEFFGTDYTVENYDKKLILKKDIERLQKVIDLLQDTSSLDYGYVRNMTNDFGAERVKLEKQLKKLGGGK